MRAIHRGADAAFLSFVCHGTQRGPALRPRLRPKVLPKIRECNGPPSGDRRVKDLNRLNHRAHRLCDEVEKNRSALQAEL